MVPGWGDGGRGMVKEGGQDEKSKQMANGIVMNIIILISSWFRWESWNLISFLSDVHQSGEKKNGGQLIVICETE